MKNLILALCILVVGCFSTNDSRKPASNKPSDILKLADGGSRDEDASQDAAIEPDPVESNDASAIDSGTVEMIDAETVDAAMVDAGTDASSNIGHTDAGLPYVNDGDQCDDCVNVDCKTGYSCNDNTNSDSYQRCVQNWSSSIPCPAHTIMSPISGTNTTVVCKPGDLEPNITCDQWRMLTGDYD